MEEYRQSAVALWNEAMLEAIRAGGAKPTATTYQLFNTSTAIFDAWAAYDDDAFGLRSNIERPGEEQTDANKIEAVSYAAYRMLTTFFPTEVERFDALMEEFGLDPANTSTDITTAAGVGNAAAQAVLASLPTDGSNFENGFESTVSYEPVNSADPDAPNAPGGDTFDPNAWQPLRVPNGTAVDENGIPVATDDQATYDDQIALTPHWGSVRPFALSSGDEFRPPAPPRLGDERDYVDGLGNVTTANQAYIDQFTEVLEVSAGLTDEQKVIAEFWADGPRTESPPGHWNQIAQDLAKRDEHTIDEDAQMFFALNAALYDAGIATWEAKYFYDFVRPQSAIRDLFFDQEVEAWAGPNQGTQTILGQDWQPYQNVTFVTPPFPEYVSGHSTFSNAAANVLADFTGTDAFYDGVTESNYDLNGDGEIDLLGEFVALDLAFEDYDGEPIVLQWDTLSAAADEAGVSRIFGGIHIQDGNLNGLAVGESVADKSFARATAHFTRGGDDRFRTDADGEAAIAGAGDDYVLARDGNDEIEGGLGDDRLVAQAGDDTLFGGEGDDVLFGRAGSDVLDGGAGFDRVFGGADADLFVLSLGSGEERVYDFDTTEDLVDVSGLGVTGLDDLTIREIGGSTVLRSGDERMVLVNQEEAELGADSFVFAPIPA